MGRNYSPFESDAAGTRLRGRGETTRRANVRSIVSVRLPTMLLFALLAIGCASSRPPEPVVVERIYYLPAPVSPPAPCPCPPAVHHAKPKRHRHGPPRSVIGARDPSHHGHGARPPTERGHGPRATRPNAGHGPHASRPPRKPPTRAKLPPDRRRAEKPRRSLRAEVPEGCTGACRDEMKRRARECRRTFDRSRVIECIERLEHEMRRASGATKPKG